MRLLEAIKAEEAIPSNRTVVELKFQQEGRVYRQGQHPSNRTVVELKCPVTTANCVGRRVF